MRHLLHFSAGKFDSIEIRKDVEVDGESTAMTRNLGVLDITEQRALCNQIPNGAPYHEAINGGRSGLVPAKSGALFSPGMQCYWQIIPTQPVQEIHLQFLHMGQAFGDGCQLQVIPARQLYTLPSIPLAARNWRCLPNVSTRCLHTCIPR